MKINIIKIALDEQGYSEYPVNSNKTKYGSWFGLNGVSWCGIFVSWVYDKVGLTLPNIGYTKGFAGCDTAFAYFKKKNWITNSPIPADIILFDFKKNKTFQHTGIYLSKIDNECFLSIEGNTSINGSQNNGGQVCIKLRKYSDSIFIHPIL